MKRKCLFASAVGTARKKYLIETIKSFGKKDFDYIIFCYDNTVFNEDIFNDVKIIYDNGSTYGFGKKYLTPKVVKDYDYIFLWVDDIDTTDFDVNNFLNLFEYNKLDIAQPSINNRGIIANWVIVRQQSNKFGRFTNFIETQVPVFTKSAWLKFRRKILPDCQSGWGYDLLMRHLFNFKMGVVDCESVAHMELKNSKSVAGPLQLKKLEQHYDIKVDYNHEELGEMKYDIEDDSLCKAKQYRKKND